MWAGDHFSVFITETFHFFKTKLLRIIQNIVKVRKSVKIVIMKFEVVLFEVMRTVMTNCKFNLAWPNT